MKEGESIDKSPKPLGIAPLFTSDCEGPTGDWKESNKESTEGKWGLGGRAFNGGCPVLKLPDTSPDTLLKTGLALMPETKLDGGALGGGGSTGGKGSGLIVSDRDSRGSSLSSSACTSSSRSKRPAAGTHNAYVNKQGTKVMFKTATRDNTDNTKQLEKRS